MFLGTKIATGALAGVLTLSLTGAAALAAFQPAEPTPSAAVRGSEAQVSGADREKNGGLVQALEAILGRLVANGTITAEQKAEILAAVRSEGEGRQDGAGHLKRILGRFMALSVEYLGLERGEIKAALRAGTSLGALADETEGKSRDEMIVFITVEVGALIDQAVADEKLTAERAEAAKDGLAERVTKFVDHVFEKRGAEGAKELRERLKERAKDLKERFKERREERKADRGDDEDEGDDD